MQEEAVKLPVARKKRQLGAVDLKVVPGQGVAHSCRQIAVKRAPERFKARMVKAFNGECSPRVAIATKCYECCGFQRMEVYGCRAYGCPLWNFRPQPGKGEQNEDSEAALG